MKTPISTQSLLLVLFLSTYLSHHTFAQITPWVNKTAHYNSPIIMSMSDDGKYLLSGDKDGYIAIRDIETKKMVRSYHTKGKLQALFFKKGSYDILSVHSENGILKASHINFKTKNAKNIFSRGFNIENFKIDVSPNKDKLQILYDSLHEELQLIGEAAIGRPPNFDVIESHYNQDGNAEYLMHIDSNYTLITDLNNRTVYRNNIDSTYECTDHSIGKTAKLKEEIILDLEKLGNRFRRASMKKNANGRSPIKINFKFSPDGKQICLITTIKSRRELILYSIQNEKVKWRKPFPGGLIFSSEIAWLNNERLLFTEIPSFISEYNTDGEFLEPIQNDYSIQASLEINNDLTKILYSLKSRDTSTYLFDLLNPNKLNRIDSNYNELLMFDENETVYFTEKGGDPCKQHTIKTIKNGLLDSFKQFIPYFSINNLNAYHSGNIVIYTAKSSLCLQEKLSKAADSLIYSKEGKKTGFIIDDIKFIDDKHVFHHGGLQDSIQPFSGNHIIIHDLAENRSTVILNSNIHQLKSNFDGTQITYAATKDLDYQTYNIGGESIEDYGNESLLFFAYAQNSPMACRITRSGQLKVWNTQTNDKTFVFSDPTILTKVSAVAFIEEENKLLLLSQNKLFSVDYKQVNSKPKVFYSSIQDINDFYLSKDKSYLYMESTNSATSNSTTTSTIVNRKTLSLIYEYSFNDINKHKSDPPKYENFFFSENMSSCMLYDGLGQFKLINLKNGKLLLTLRLFNGGEWLAYTPDGYFDASQKGRESLYYVSGDEVILYSQIKERLWEPDLLQKLLNDPNYFDGQQIGVFPLYPSSEIKLLENTDQVNIVLKGNSGGIGKVSLYINDKEIVEDINPSRKESISISLLEHEGYLYSHGLNRIGVKTYNEAGWISSRINYLYLETNLSSAKDTSTDQSTFTQTTKRRRSSNSIKRPGLYGLFIGSSIYNNSDLNLDFADKDAVALKDAFDLISEDMYNPKRKYLYKLTSDSDFLDSLPSRKNILEALSMIKDSAQINDIVVLFLSGHGITIDDDFYYLTTQVGSENLTTETERRSQVCISSTEIMESLRDIKANKQFLILDACHSGKIADFLQNKTKSLSTSQQKALESLEDKIGTYILASSEANQKSFEVKQLNQGLLTHSLLLGMSGEADDRETIDIIKLLNYASRQTEEVSKNVLGTSQRPVIGIGEGGSSFDIGFKNESLKPPVPSEYVKFGRGKFGVLPTFIDPENIEEAFNKTLESQGVFGGTQEFIYLKNENKGVYLLTGSYEVDNDQSIKILLNILKENKVFGDPIEFETSLDDLQTTINEMIQRAVAYIKTLN